ncbi:hypothetical protein HYV84_02475 [Candidatus Woesearchaeota archaeon]|nr:hypothetical protein [Candidatus Woesearchaeota archaeon]
MAAAIITGILLILSGAFFGSVHLRLVTADAFPFDPMLIGVVFFIMHESFALFHNLRGDGNKIIGAGVPLLFIAAASAHFWKEFLPAVVGQNLYLVLGVLMAAEGLYRLH